jgi:glycosyltransferase involved in cell wall biosynthesis
MTLTLFMIVKNESRIITRCLDHVRDMVDHVVITDTGSTDDTVELIETYLASHNLPGKVVRGTWINFGHNRSKSLTHAQEWLAEHYRLPVDQLTDHYLLTIDADMIVTANGFDKSALSTYQAWDIKQVNDRIHYDNRRIFRADLPYRCVGVTHEYWDSPVKVTSGRLATIVIDDRGDGGCKSDKFSRDIALLTKGIEDEPQHRTRYCFYLAQSYADSNDRENALTWYQKRIDAGGWNEEIFMSHLRRGDLYADLGKPEQAVAEWLTGYNVLPKRAETLYRLARHYRLLSQHHLSYLFVKQALAIPYPADLVLFIEHPVYHYQLKEELSIVAYYVGQIREGMEACEYLLLTPGIPEHLRNMTVTNHFFYIQSLNASSRVLSIPVDEPYLSSSACLTAGASGMKGVVRAVNYSMDDAFHYTMRDTKGIVRTKNYWMESDKEGVLQRVYEIETTGGERKRDSHIKGIEDIRVCEHKGEIYGIGVSWEHGAHNHPSIVFFRLDDNDGRYVIRTLKPVTFCDHICQKNWTLCSDGEHLCVVYSHHPLTILRLDTETAEATVMKREYTGYELRDVRGSSNPIRVGDDWLVLTHEVVVNGTRKYYHRFLMYSSDWKLKRVGIPFYLKQFYVEFSLSVMYDGKNVVIPYSTRDNTTEIATIPYDELSWNPTP